MTATVAAGAVVVPQNPVVPLSDAQAAIKCSTATGGKKFYPGKDSSRVYNRTFGPGPSIDHWLKDYVPQGLALWPDWKGKQDVFLVSMHHRNEKKNHSLLYAMTPGGKRLGTVKLPKDAHAGSVKVYGKWMYVQQDRGMIRRYNLGEVRRKLSAAGAPKLEHNVPIRIGTQRVSFFDIYRGYLYAGYHNAGSRDWMQRYKITAGGLIRDKKWGRVQVPKKTQGVFVSDDTYIFSTSAGRENRSNIYVVRRGYNKNIENVRYRCFRAPVLSQDLERYNGEIYLLFEGGADQFDAFGWWNDSENKIKRLHKTSAATLRNMVW